MDQGNIIGLAKEAFMISMMVSAPLLMVSLTAGLVISILQAATQVHEQTLTFVPKLVLIGLTMVTMGSWMIKTMVNYTIRLYGSIQQFM